ncbi:siderophore-interacting protein [Rhodococcus sp. NPDC003318]|uniref:siderophore-interacting protein n=1 Tax=Rhodococcus sp. NPDC003318 TaxID=3364503 RepID=UPI003674625A
MTTPDEPRLPARVTDVTTLSPSLRRVRLGGPDLRDWSTSGDPDERVLIAFGDDPEHGHRRSYTVRAWDPDRRTVDVDFAVHAGGAAARWARTAVPGTPVLLSSPKGWWNPPAGARRLLLLADLTALPAAGRIVESLGPAATVRLVAEVPDERDRQEWDTAADLRVTWLTGTGNGGSPSALPQAIADLPGLADVEYLWFGGETGASRRVRTLLRRTLGWSPDRYHVMGYWQADREAWLERYAEVEERIEALTARELASGRTLEEVRDAIDDALTAAGL